MAKRTALEVEHPRNVRVKQMQSLWAGRLYEDLVSEYGPPLGTMPIASRPVSIVVYEGMDPVSHCIDSFTLAKRNGVQVVDNYFCR